MSEKTLFLLNLTVAASYLLTVLHYLPNIKQRSRQIFWMFNVSFVVFRQIFISISIKNMAVDTGDILNTLLSTFISGYMIYYIITNYGHAEIIKQGIRKKQMQLINKIIPFNISHPSELLGVRGYKFDIHAFLNTLTDEWQYIQGTAIKYRKYKGKRKYECDYAVEILIEKENVDFPLQWHDYNEYFEVFKGWVQVKDDLVATIGNDIVVIEHDTHNYKCPSGTHHVSYFVK